MIFVELRERFWGDEKVTPFPSFNDRSIKPFLIDPEEDFSLANVKHCGQTLHRKEIAPDLSQAEMIPSQHVSDRLRASLQLLRDLIDGFLYQLFTDGLELGFTPTAVFGFAFESMLDDETPAGFLGPARVPL
jgi:hypothetical protein